MSMFEIKLATGTKSRKIPHRLDRHLGVDVRIDTEQRVGAEQQRVAVGLGVRGDVGRDVAVRSGPVVDHDLLAEPVAERCSDCTRDHVDRAAGRERHNQPDRPVGIGLRGGRTNNGGQDNKRRQNDADEAKHVAPSCPILSNPRPVSKYQSPNSGRAIVAVQRHLGQISLGNRGACKSSFCRAPSDDRLHSDP
jgi:hypothetical protein